MLPLARLRDLFRTTTPRVHDVTPLAVLMR